MRIILAILSSSFLTLSCEKDFIEPLDSKYYVSVNGSNGNPGTFESPFATIQFGYDKLLPGQTLEVLPGTYEIGTFRMNKSGTKDQPITVRSDGAILYTRGGYVVNISGDYNILEGFGITGANYAGIILYGNYNTVKNCEIYENVKAGRSGGIYTSKETSTHGNSFIGNYVHNNGRAGSNVYDHGLYINEDSSTIAYNIITDNSAWGILLGNFNTGIKVYNNVIIGNRYGGIILHETIKYSEIFNNIIMNNANNGLDCWGLSAIDVKVFNNNFWGNLSNWHPGCSVCAFSSNLSLDPMLIEFHTQNQTLIEKNIGIVNNF